MKIIKCRDLGFNCDFMATGSAAEADGVKQKMMDHILEKHLPEKEMSDEDIEDIASRIEILLSRGCGCGAL
ncbi:DUF1059 domain-containing protein [Methanococcoides methylutens]|uniref:DUF1059 domain-containing protein n=1 Tax=Methanococcoides methylutens MM1 TaxID=1434104 RepID=A0A0E3SSC8_METMT|nr:DUF1059 domain-containing protein [Methanococcoides methylutens]AKB86076.1 hypothetical protein MCMEM_2023 [Methanococcoides methylutens MM1]